MEETKEKLNSMSFRYGGTGTDMKLYFSDADDLEEQMNKLNDKAGAIRLAMDSVKSKLGE